MADHRTPAYGILQPYFRPRAVAPLLPSVRKVAGKLIDHFTDRGECDLTEDFAIPLPAEVFLTLSGLPVADRDRLIAWKDAILDTVGIRGAKGSPAESAKLGAELFVQVCPERAVRLTT
ncbi:MAG: hypothetical protein ACM3ML_16605 [Micromonosporaceae bacterium]